LSTRGVPTQAAVRAAAKTAVTASQRLAPTSSPLACSWWNQPSAVPSLQHQGKGDLQRY
jgi:hypothetical protein